MLNKIILLTSSVLSVVSGKAVKPRYPDISLIITPFLYGKESYILFATVDLNSKVVVTITNDLYPSGVELFSHTFSNLEKYVYAYDNKYTSDSNTINFEYTSSGGVTNNYSKTIKVVSSQIKYLDDDTILESSSFWSFTKKGWVLTTETLEFMGFEDFYVPDFYHKFDPSTLLIKQTGYKNNLVLNNATFLISNVNGVFNNLNSSTKWAQIKLKTVKDEETYHLEFGERLYVNPSTLKMSTKKFLGYVPTKYLYFPINYFSNQQDFSCSISLGEFGVCRDKLVHTFKLRAPINLFGDCINSEYCIGEIVK